MLKIKHRAITLKTKPIGSTIKQENKKMAKNIRAQVLGGQVKDLNDVDTIQDVLDALELDGAYAATINGEPAENDTELNDYEFVTFAAAVKGGLI